MDLAFVQDVINKDYSFFSIIKSIWDAISSIWKYSIYTTTDMKSITLANVVVAIILFIFGLQISKYLSYITRKKLLDVIKLEPSVKNALEKLIHYFYITFITLFVFNISDVPLTLFTFVGGALALSIGLGSQNILNNFISGLIILIEQPIRIGDIVEINDIVGKVITIGARCINIRTSSNIDVLIPNSVTLQNTVINWTLNDHNIRVSLIIPLDIEAPHDKVEEILLDIMMDNKEILKDPSPSVYLISLNEQGFLEFELNFWINITKTTDRKKIISEINKQSKRILSEHKIKFAANPISTQNIMR